MPAPACNAAIAPTLMIRAEREAARYGSADRDAFSAVSTLIAYMRCQVFGSPSATVSNAKAPAILIKASSRPNCAAAASIAFLACAASDRSTPPSSIRLVDAGHFCAARKRRFRNHLAERARGAGYDNDFSIHDRSPGQKVARANYRQTKFICNALINFAQMQVISCEQMEVYMCDAPPPCDIAEELIRLRRPLLHLVQALRYQRKIKIVAIGSSSTAGEGDVMPYPYRLELALRNRFPDRMIDVLNRGIGGQEAPEELSRFEPDVIAEAPTLVIWQVGTNAIYHRDLYDPHRVAGTIATGLGWLGALEADVILMDLQYAPALLTPQKIDDTRLMVSLISAAADTARANLFPRFALMHRWHEEDGIPFDTMINSADGLHQTDWSTNCVTKALFRAIEQAVVAET